MRDHLFQNLLLANPNLKVFLQYNNDLWKNDVQTSVEQKIFCIVHVVRFLKIFVASNNSYNWIHH